MPASQFGPGKPRLARPEAADMRKRMERNATPLGEYVQGQFYRGIVSGLNEAFVVGKDTRDRLVANDAKSCELLKPLLVGDDVRRYELHYRDAFYVYVPWECPIKEYSAIFRHLKKHEQALAARPEVRAGRFPWYAMSRYGSDFSHLFGKPKIQYPDIAMESRFAMDSVGFYGTNTTYFVSGSDWYLLGALNSGAAFSHLKGSCAILGDEDKKGRLRLFGQTLESLPIPNAGPNDREAVARLAQRAQELHTQRRKRVEEFLRDIGTSPAESSSKNRLEEPWNTDKCTDDYFSKKAKGYPLKLLSDVRDETIAMTDEILKVEAEIDERVKGLYGL